MTGTVIRIIGAVLDIAFPVDAIPPIHNLVYVLDDKHDRKVPCEVVQHLPGAVRCVSLEATEGLSRGLLVEDTGAPISLKRLEARPIATLSVEAQERHEKREKVYRDE